MQSVGASTLIPRGFVVDDAVNDVDGTLITMRPIGGGELVSGVRSTFGTDLQSIFSASCGSAHCGP